MPDEMPDEMDWLDDDEDGDAPWDFPPKAGTPESWLGLFRREFVTVLLCPDAILGRVCASLRLALRTDEERRRNTVIMVIPRGDEATLMSSSWAERTCEGIRQGGMDAFIIIPEDRTDVEMVTTDGLGVRVKNILRCADRVVELSCDPGGEACCVHRTLKDREVEDLFGKISFLG